MSLVSFFTARCKWCDDQYRIGTGSADECNRCRTVMTLIRPLSIHEIEKLLNALKEEGVAEKGDWRITWVSR